MLDHFHKPHLLSFLDAPDAFLQGTWQMIRWACRAPLVGVHTTTRRSWRSGFECEDKAIGFSAIIRVVCDEHVFVDQYSGKWTCGVKRRHGWWATMVFDLGYKMLYEYDRCEKMDTKTLVDQLTRFVDNPVFVASFVPMLLLASFVKRHSK